MGANFLEFARRSYQPELLDDLRIAPQDLARNLRELAAVNRLLGGHRNLFRLIRQEAPRHADPLRIADVGCGGGDALHYLTRQPGLAARKLELTGLDHSPLVLDYARQHHGHPLIRYQQLDALKPWPAEQYHLICFNLVLHHFTDAQLITLLQRASRQGQALLITDLHRSRLAYAGFACLARLLGFSYVSRHDGLLSVRKSFTRRDWHRLCRAAGLPPPEVSWRWAFRWAVVVRPGGQM
ncbi:MAG: methyltransferase domain-containing protein [Schleiferiaceae bacterium]|nr:methyltransferase domain-containing protein [Schleiferiaceae bacterium]